LCNCTISSSTAGTGGTGGFGTPPGSSGDSGVGGGVWNTASAQLVNTLITGDSAPGAGPDVSGNFSSWGCNLVGNTSGSSGFGATSDLLGVNALIGPLADNGGPTFTCALLAGSPAINAGTAAGAPATDQRGISRPQMVLLDIGAFEFTGPWYTGSWPDTDGDGIPDWWEKLYGLNPMVNDAKDSLTSDGLSNLEVYLFDKTNTLGITLDPRNPYSNPMGTNGVSDYEFLHGVRGPTHYSYDRDDRLVGVEYQNGTTIGYQYDGNGNLLRQMTFNRYLNCDGLPAMWKFLNGLNPTNSSGTNALYADADGDGWSNYQEWQAGSNPLDPNSVPVTNIVQSAPVTSVLPQTNNVGALVPVLTRLWNAVGGSAIPYLQYQVPGSTNWQDAPVAQADGVPYTYSFSNRIAALPTGSDHVLTWNASVMFTNNMSLTARTNVLLRARAQAVTMMGAWSAPVNYTLVADADGNGLPDAWELQYFGHTGVNPNDDPDRDGFSNLQEYIADTNPLDSNSYLRITSAQLSTNGVQINWSGGVQARQYLQRNSSIGGTNTWVNIQTAQPPTAINGSYADPPTTNKASFYRIRVQRP
jgi:YD repeat-containing protein